MRFFSSILLALLILTPQFTRAAGEALMPVGVAQVDITPDYPIRLSGFGGRRTESEGVTKHIWAKALAIADEKNGPAILITAENVSVPDEITSEIARRLAAKIGLKRERLTVTATHTHTAPMLKNVCPTLFGVPIPPEHQQHIDRYTVEFTDALEKVALEAMKTIRPAKLSWGIGNVDFAVNRRTKGGPVDHDLPMLAVRDPDGKLRAIYFSYACHCVTLSNNKISGDWAGFAEDKIQELFPGTIAMASVGCGADSNPSSGVTGDNVAVVGQQGDQVAQEIKRLLGTALKPIHAQPVLHYQRIDLPLAPARTREEWERRAKQQDAVGYHARVNLERLDRGETLPDKINYPVQTWIFGEDLVIVFLPGETVVDYSLRLKRQFDRTRLWVNGYSNDARCYVPSERVLKEGGYEGGDAMIYYDFPQKFAPGLEQIIINAVTAQIPAAFKAPPGTEGTRPLTPSEALRSFRTKPGLKVELVAAEPLIQDPVAIDWGANGTLWVCEMNDYPTGMDQNWQPGGRVKFLVDDDHDGRYDRATLFLDNIPFPTGITSWGRGVLICAAPDILYAEDTNHDGKADKVEKLFTGFFTDNYQARVNSLTLGLDNWIYGANGLLGGKIDGLKNSLLSSTAGAVDIRNRDFRFHPFHGPFETVSGLTQQGRVRDDWGNWFGCDNSHLVFQFPFPETYIRRNPHVPAPESARNLTARPDGNRLYPTSPLLERFNDPDNANRVTSACGLGLYRDTLLGKEFYSNAFTCEPVHNLVHREVLEEHAVFTSHRAADERDSEFLSSCDNWFRPVQARPGPDGALYVVDMYRFLIEHPRWIPAARLAQIDVRAGADRGRIYRVIPSDATPRVIRDLTKLHGADLAQAMDTPNGVDRDRVQVELLLRQDKQTIKPLQGLAEHATLPQVRVQALAVLDGLAAIRPKQIQTALKDPEPHVREHALRLAEPFLRKNDGEGAALLKSVVALTNDPSIFVLRQLAYTLGESTAPEAGQALGALARAWLQNVEIRTAVISSAAHHCGEVLSAVMSAGSGAAGRAEWIAPLITTAAGSDDMELIGRAIRASLPPKGEALNDVHMTALAALLEKSNRRPSSRAQWLDAATDQQIRDAISAALKLAGDEGAPEKTRAAAVALIAQAPSDQSLAILASIATQPSPLLRHSAVAALKRWKLPSVATEILSRWRNATPFARSELVTFLLDREEWTVPLLNAVRDGVVLPNEFSRADRQRLASSDKPRLRKLAAEFVPVETMTGRAEVLEKYKETLKLAGSASAGAEVFTKNCSSCHALNGIGHAVGPDLAALRIRDAEYWIKNILDPNAVIEPRFVNYQIELKDDRTLGGLIQNETATSLTVVSGNGVSETVLRSEISNIRASTLSLMPEGLEQGITPKDMADLIAFARSGNPRKQVAGNTPRSITAGEDSALMLHASEAEIYGQDITFEGDFQNIGMWHGAEDQVVWSLQIAKPGRYDVYLDYASAANASDNQFVLTVGEQSITGKIPVTGDDWSSYKQLRAGSLDLAAGSQRAVLRPEGPVHTALLDLRTVALVPAGRKPKWPSASQPHDDVLRDPASIAHFILDSSRPENARTSAINANPQFSSTLITEMTRDLTPGSSEEYARIPWIWRVAIACGRRNDSAQIKSVLEASLPKENEPLRDWQAVVAGGGIINGISQRGVWPADRIREVLAEDDVLKSRWSRALDLSSKMADDENVPSGTRYDALRMLGVAAWEQRGEQLVRYLRHANAELQMGAVSAISDMETAAATEALVNAFAQLTKDNQKLALEALLRSPARKLALLDGVHTKKILPTVLDANHISELRGDSDEVVRTRARTVFRARP